MIQCKTFKDYDKFHRGRGGFEPCFPCIMATSDLIPEECVNLQNMTFVSIDSLHHQLRRREAGLEEEEVQEKH
jgi:hypothetical protein